MKFRYRMLEIAVFCCIFLLFVLPVLIPFSEGQKPVTGSVLSIFQLELAVISCSLFFINRKYAGKNLSCETEPKYENSKLKQLLNSGICIFTLGLLFLVNGLLQLAVRIFSAEIEIPELNRTVSGVIIAVVNFISAVICEEFVFRYYFPEVFTRVLSKKISNERTVLIIQTAFTAVLFGICHYNNGIFAVINAAVAHLSLYFCYKKTGNIICNLSVHLIYNLLVYAALFIQQ